MGEYDAWLGREESSRDQLSAAAAHRWLSTFDLPEPTRKAMPQGIHWALCTTAPPTRLLGEDGHAARDGGPQSFLPPIPYPRRMWAASACEFYAPIEIGMMVERSSRISTIETKQGRSGPLCFITILHEWRGDRRAVLNERQTLVYRTAPAASAPPEPPCAPQGSSFSERDWDFTRRLTPSMPLLLRYSALTFNAHRVHYDADYCRDQENYRGPVVHAPLIASKLLQTAAHILGRNNRLERFALRSRSPAIAGEEIILAMREIAPGRLSLAAVAADGRPVAEASAAYSPE